MKIMGIEIFGFGKFADYKLDLSPDLQVIYGENEAGKSTIMAFIHSVLFGFPTKQQSLLRYEPKIHTAYGGRIHLETSEYGRVVVERKKGKATGDVKIQLADGEVKNEEFLPILLKGMNRNTFESIFSFNLHGLQEFQRLKGEDIVRFLISAGTVGTDQLLHIENNVQEERDHLFKPSGRKPILNQKLKQLRDEQQQLLAAKQQNDQYSHLLIHAETIEKEINDLENTHDQLQVEVEITNKMMNNWDDIQELKFLKEKEPIQLIEFPVDGLSRLEGIQAHCLHLKARKSVITKKVKETKETIYKYAQIKMAETDTQLAEKFIREWPLIEQKMEATEERQKNLSSVQKEMEQYFQQLHLRQEYGESLNKKDLGLNMKGRIKAAYQAKIKNDMRMNALQITIQETSQSLKQVEGKCDEIEQKLIPEDDFIQMQRDRQEYSRYEVTVKERELIKQQLDNKENDSSSNTFISIGFLVIGFSLALWSIISTEWLFAAIGVIIVLYGVYEFYRKLRQENKGKQEIKQLQNRLAILEESIKRKPSSHLEVFETQQALRKEWKQYYQRLAEEETKLENLKIQEKEILEVYDKNDEQFYQIKIELGLPLDYLNENLEEAFEILQELSHLVQKKATLQEEIKIENEKNRKWMQELMALTSRLNINEEQPAIIIHLLQKKVQADKEASILDKELNNKVQELEDELRFLNIEYTEYEKKLLALLHSAEATTEEEFRRREKNYQEQLTLKSRYSQLNKQIHHALYKKALIYTSEEEVMNQQIQLKKKMQSVTDRLNKMRQQLAEKQHKIKLLEDGGVYADQLHHFQHMKGIFNEEAKEWATLTIMQTIIDKTMNVFIGTRFPKVVRKAQEFFSFLTNDEYQRIHLPLESELVVERKDGTIFKPTELSQGTREQLYISIRFALIDVLRDEYSFPIIVDDGFVNFDSNRTNRTIELIRSISEHTQVLFFTCHAHIYSQFSEKDRLVLSRG